MGGAAYQSYDLFDAMRKDGSKPKIIKVDGGCGMLTFHVFFGIFCNVD
jgi:glycerol kinase